MEKNIVVSVLFSFVDKNRLEFFSGKVEHIGTKKVNLNWNASSVYGLAVKIEDMDEKERLFQNKCETERN